MLEEHLDRAPGAIRGFAQALPPPVRRGRGGLAQPGGGRALCTLCSLKLHILNNAPESTLCQHVHLMHLVHPVHPVHFVHFTAILS